MFAKETYINRRRVLKESVGSGLLLFLGNTELGMNYADNIIISVRIQPSFTILHRITRDLLLL